MNDLVIKVSKINKTILPDRTTLGNDGENLQSRLVFKFIDGFVDGIARLEYTIDDENYYIIMNKENKTYTIPIKNILTKEGNVTFQLVITQEETSEGIPLYKSDIFNLYCKESINAVDEAPEGYDLWIEIANQKLMEMEEKIIEVNEAIEKTNNLNITATKEDVVTIIRITDKDGNVKKILISDGKKGVGIKSIIKTSTSGLVDTYTITFTDDTTTTFDVTNGEDGRGIVSIVKTSTVDNVDTYTITYTDGTTSTFDVTNSEVTEKELERVNMVYNALPKVTNTNTEITLNETANCPMQLELNPSELTQETTTGKNILPNNASSTTLVGVTITKNNDGSFTLNGTANSEGNLTVGEVSFERGETYTISGVTGFTESTLQLYTDSSTAFYTGNILQSYDGAVTRMARATESCNIKLCVYFGVTYNNITVYPMIVDGSTSGDYEPYTGGIPQPNPDYPSDVQVIKGNNSILIRNKNLFDKNDITSSNGYISDANGNFVSNSSQPTKASNYIYVKGINKLHFSTNMTTNRWGAFYDENKTFISGFNFSQTNPLTVPANAYYMRTTVQISILDEFQVEIGESGTDYVAHQEQVLPLNLPVENLFDKDNANILNNTLLNGTNGTIATFNGCKTLYIPIKSSTTYTISKILSARFVVGTCSNTPTTGVVCDVFNANNTATSLTITSGASDKYLCVFYYLSGTDTLTDTEIINSIQIEKGTQANQYTPYGTTPIEYCKIGDYEDEFEHIGDKWYLNKNIGKNIYTGASGEGWTYYNGIVFIDDTNIRDLGLNNNYNLLSNYFKAGVNKMYIAHTTHQRLHINLNNVGLSNITSVNGWKTWLSTHNLVVYFIQNETTTEITDTTLIEQLNAIEQAVSYDKQTNISQTNTGLPFVIKATAIRSLVNIFELINGGA